MPARKKHPSTRARQNKASTATRLIPRGHLRAADDGAGYAAMTVVQLRAEIKRRNTDRPETQRIPGRGAKAVLVAALVEDDSDVPRLPERTEPWHPRTLEWWADIWASPMSPEWDDSDLHNLLVLAAVYDDIWTADTPKGRKDAATEYRLQRADLGLSPYSRRRLEWTIEAAGEAKDRGDERRSRRTQQAAQSGSRPDPRARMQAVK